MTTDNLYQAPTAELTIDAAETQEFFVVSTRKLTIMHMLTLGSYDLYWHYRNWNQQNLKHNLGVWPVMRGLFSFFFIHSLVKRVHKSRQAQDASHIDTTYRDAFLWVLLYLAPTLINMGMLAYAPGGVLALRVPMVFLGLATQTAVLWPLLRTQRAINAVANDADGKENDQISVANMAWIAVFVLYYGVTWYNVFFRLAA